MPDPIPSNPVPIQGRALAVAAIVSGLTGPFSFGIGPVLGLLLGSVAVVRNRRAGRDPRTEKLAVAGILTSVICLPLGILAALRLFLR
jgi:hypothetical protein